MQHWSSVLLSRPWLTLLLWYLLSLGAIVVMRERIKGVLCVVYCIMFVKLRWSSVMCVYSVHTLTLSIAVRSVSSKCFYFASICYRNIIQEIAYSFIISYWCYCNGCAIFEVIRKNLHKEHMLENAVTRLEGSSKACETGSYFPVVLRVLTVNT